MTTPDPTNPPPQAAAMFPVSGVVVGQDDSDFVQPFLMAYANTDGGFTVILPDNSKHIYPLDSITQDSVTDIITFVSEGASYLVRELREDDGLWLSAYKTVLPTDALNALISGETMNDDFEVEETIDAYFSEDSVYLLGVVYTSGSGVWARMDGDWLALAPDDDTFGDMMVLEIDPEKADEFLALFDANFVTVTDAEKFETAASVESEPESADS